MSSILRAVSRLGSRTRVAADAPAWAQAVPFIHPRRNQFLAVAVILVTAATTMLAVTGVVHPATPIWVTILALVVTLWCWESAEWSEPLGSVILRGRGQIRAHIHRQDRAGQTLTRARYSWYRTVPYGSHDGNLRSALYAVTGFTDDHRDAGWFAHQLHRRTGPAVIEVDPDGTTIVWTQATKSHRTDGPAYINTRGATYLWAINGNDFISIYRNDPKAQSTA